MDPDSPMAPDDLQRAWQAHASETRVTIRADLLAREVARSGNLFRAVIFWRDFREAAVALLLIPIWIFMGLALSLPWTWYLEVPACIWLVIFILVDRRRHPQNPPEPGAPLLEGVRESLRQVEHQIWLLRNVHWWYIMPGFVAMLPFLAQVAWQTHGAGLIVLLFVAAVDVWIYFINQLAVRKQLEPRRQELLALLASLSDETADQVAGEYPILTGAGSVPFSRRRMIIGTVIFVVCLAIGVGGIFVARRMEEGYPKKSPFAAVRWQGTEPEVKVGDEWFKLVSLDDVPAAEIVAFCRRTYENKWRKRFEEDLVEVLSRMGHPPGNSVKLVVQSLTSAETRTINDVPMTRANRQAIRDAAEARERKESSREHAPGRSE